MYFNLNLPNDYTIYIIIVYPANYVYLLYIYIYIYICIVTNKLCTNQEVKLHYI